MYHRECLGNGLRVIGETIPHVHSVSIGLWVAAGSRDEAHGQQGISHLIEHMLFKGTRSRSARKIAEEIDAVGGQLNAFTTREYTCYYAKVLAAHIGLGLELLADMYCHASLDAEEMEKEKGVVIEEIRSYEDAPDELVHELLAAALWPVHPLGQPIIGTPESVGDLTKREIAGFIDTFYRPAGTVLSVAGKLDFSEFLSLAEKNLSELAPGGEGMPREIPIPASRHLVRKKETEQVHLCLGGPGVKRSSPDKYVVQVLDSILGGSVSSRLFQKLREEEGLVYATGTAHSSFCDAGAFSIYAGTAPESVPDVMRMIRAETDRLVRELVPESELLRAKEQIKGAFLLSMESTSTRMSRLARAEIYHESALTPEEVISRLEMVTAEDIMRLAGLIFQEGPHPMAAVGPNRGGFDLEGILEESVVSD